MTYCIDRTEKRSRHLTAGSTSAIPDLVDGRRPALVSDHIDVYVPPSHIPLGPIEIRANEEGLTWISFSSETASPIDPSPIAPSPITEECARQLEAYFLGQLRDFDLPLAPRGTEFQRAVWQALSEIPFGETRTYAEQAGSLGNPKAVRAVGAANGRNPISIVVPCHRVIGANGTLTGYAGGLPRKRWLLHHEQGRTNPLSI